MAEPLEQLLLVDQSLNFLFFLLHDILGLAKEYLGLRQELLLLNNALNYGLLDSVLHGFEVVVGVQLFHLDMILAEHDLLKTFELFFFALFDVPLLLQRHTVLAIFDKRLLIFLEILEEIVEDTHLHLSVLSSLLLRSLHLLLDLLLVCLVRVLLLCCDLLLLGLSGRLS